MGDFNSDIKRQQPRTTKHDTMFVKFLAKTEFQSIASDYGPTRRGINSAPSTIDHILIDRNSTHLCTDIKVHKNITLSSDHCLLIFSLKAPTIRTDTLWGQPEKYVSHWNETTIGTFQKHLNKELTKITNTWNNLPKSKTEKTKDIDMISELLIKALTNASSSIWKKTKAKLSTDVTKVPLHVDAEINILISTRNDLLKSLHNDENEHKNTATWEQIHDAQRSLSNIMKNEITRRDLSWVWNGVDAHERTWSEKTGPFHGI
jgi:hypothetical protein